MEKIALFIDWDNLRKDIEALQRSKDEQKYKNINVYSADNIYEILKKFIKKEESLYRILIYTAPPMPYDEIDKIIRRDNKRLFETDDGVENEIAEKYQLWFNFASKDNEYNRYTRASSFLREIASKEYIAVRKGYMKIKGINFDEGWPIFQQKSVDMLLGIDIANIVHNKVIDKVLIYSNDADMIPALKYARNNGLQTVLYHFDENTNRVCNTLKPHIDEFRRGNLCNMIVNLGSPF